MIVTPEKQMNDPDALWVVDLGGLTKACIRWVVHWRHLVNTVEPSICGSDATFCQITLTTCFHTCNVQNNVMCMHV